MLLEIEKTVVEGAGAVGLAALLKYPEIFKGKKILLVEDNKINQMITNKMLTNKEIKCTIIDNGEEAVEMIIEAKDNNDALFLEESADLLFHYLLLLNAKGHNLQDVIGVLTKRHSK